MGCVTVAGRRNRTFTKNMKTTIENPFEKNTATGLLTSTMILSADTYAKKSRLLTSPILPETRGYVKIKLDDNHNYIIRIHLLNIPEVAKLHPPEQSYIVWMKTDDGITKNIAQIKNSTGALSKRLTASFETVSSFKPDEIFITAEDDALTQFPGPQVILSTNSLYKNNFASIETFAKELD